MGGSFTTIHLIMKMILLITSLIICSSTSQAQFINGKPLTEIVVPYIKITTSQLFATNKVGAQIDYGQVDKRRSYKDNVITDESGKSLEFNSEMDVLNMFHLLGYELILRYGSNLKMEGVGRIDQSVFILKHKE